MNASNFESLREFQLSLPDFDADIEVDIFRNMWIDEPTESGINLFVAYFENQEDLDANDYGSALLVHISQPITKETTMKGLLESKAVKACYWGVNQQNDVNVPSFSFQSLSGPDKSMTLGLTMMNHIESPYLYSI